MRILKFYIGFEGLEGLALMEHFHFLARRVSVSMVNCTDSYLNCTDSYYMCILTPYMERGVAGPMS